MKKMNLILMSILVLSMLLAFAVPAFAEAAPASDGTSVQTEEAVAEETDNSSSSKAWAAGIAVGIAAAVGAISMGIAVSKSSESIARQPEAAGKINSAMMLGLVFIETAIIYALIVAILIIFVL